MKTCVFNSDRKLIPRGGGSRTLRSRSEDGVSRREQNLQELVALKRRRKTDPEERFWLGVSSADRLEPSNRYSCSLKPNGPETRPLRIPRVSSSPQPLKTSWNHWFTSNDEQEFGRPELQTPTCSSKVSNQQLRVSKPPPPPLGFLLKLCWLPRASFRQTSTPSRADQILLCISFQVFFLSQEKKSTYKPGSNFQL